MSHFNFNHIRITGVAAAVPSERIIVSDFYEIFGEDYVRKFSESTGVSEFRKTQRRQTASDLCFAAAENIMNKKGIGREEIGLLLFVAHSTDYRRPATACVLHKRLGLAKNCAAFDIGLGCSAFVYGLQTACSMMECSDIKKALVLVGETLTKMVNPKDKSLAMLFGDGGSAVLLEKTEDISEISGVLNTDGSGYRAIIAPAGGFRNMNASHGDFLWPDGNVRSLYNTIMQGEDVFSFTISDVYRTVKDFLKHTHTSVQDYDFFAFHQANQLIHKLLCKKLKVPEDKMPLCLGRYGNSSAAAIPLVICDQLGDNDTEKDISFLMCGFGVGLSWGVCSAVINIKDILPVIETDEIFEEGIINSPDDLYGQ